MKISFITIVAAFLILLMPNESVAQYDFYLKEILGVPKAAFQPETGEFIRKNGILKGELRFEFGNNNFPITYFHPGNDCGYFQLYGKNYSLKGKYAEGEEFGCFLDEMSFEVFSLQLNGKSYYLLSSIADVSGKGTRDVFLNLFDVTDKKNVQFYSVWSLYGSGSTLGDYDNDGNLDFMEVRYEKSSKDTDTFRLRFKTMKKDRSGFEEVPNKYVIFQQAFINNRFEVTKVEKHL